MQTKLREFGIVIASVAAAWALCLLLGGIYPGVIFAGILTYPVAFASIRLAHLNQQRDTLSVTSDNREV